MSRSDSDKKKSLTKAYRTLDSLFLEHLLANPENRHAVHYGPFSTSKRRGYRYSALDGPLFMYDDVDERELPKNPHRDFCVVGLNNEYAAIESMLRGRLTVPHYGYESGTYYPNIPAGDKRVYRLGLVGGSVKEIIALQRLDGDLVSERVFEDGSVFYWDFSKIAAHPDFKLLRYANATTISTFAERVEKLDEILRRNPGLSISDISLLKEQRILL